MGRGQKKEQLGEVIDYIGVISDMPCDCSGHYTTGFVCPNFPNFYTFLYSRRQLSHRWELGQWGRPTARVCILPGHRNVSAG